MAEDPLDGKLPPRLKALPADTTDGELIQGEVYAVGKEHAFEPLRGVVLQDWTDAVLADLLPPRRPRTSVRKVKSPLSRYNKKDPYRPERSTPITGVAVTISDPEPKDTTHQSKCLTTALGP